MYFSIVPPCLVIAALITSKYRFITSRSDSGSSVSPRLVDPFKSQKRIETTLRTSCAGAAAASGVPQNPHSRNFGGFSSPQFEQVIMARSSLDETPEL